MKLYIELNVERPEGAAISPPRQQEILELIESELGSMSVSIEVKGEDEELMISVDSIGTRATAKK